MHIVCNLWFVIWNHVRYTLYAAYVSFESKGLSNQKVSNPECEFVLCPMIESITYCLAYIAFAEIRKRTYREIFSIWNQTKFPFSLVFYFSLDFRTNIFICFDILDILFKGNQVMYGFHLVMHEISCRRRLSSKQFFFFCELFLFRLCCFMYIMFGVGQLLVSFTNIIFQLVSIFYLARSWSFKQNMVQKHISKFSYFLFARILANDFELWLQIKKQKQ